LAQVNIVLQATAAVQELAIGVQLPISITEESIGGHLAEVNRPSSRQIP